MKTLVDYFKSYLKPVGWPCFLAAVLISAVFWYYFLWKYQRQTILRVAVYAVYTAVVLGITLLGRPSGFIESGVNKLFGTWQKAFIENLPKYRLELLYNTLLFVPLGFIFADCGFSKKKAVLFTFLASLGIETLQLLTGRGVFEICDLVHNTLGGFLGAVLFPAIMKIIDKLRAAGTGK